MTLSRLTAAFLFSVLYKIIMEDLHTLPLSVYQQNGYDNREAYLADLAEDYGEELVQIMTSVLPASEDFDGLVTSLEDAADGYM